MGDLGRPAVTSQRILTQRFDDVTPGQVLELLAARPAEAGFVYVVTPNADHLVRLDRAGAELQGIYEKAWLSLCDGRWLKLMAAWRGVRLSLVPGSDLTQQLFEVLIGPETPVTVIGCSDTTVSRLRARFGLRRLAHHNPPMGFIRDPAAIAACLDFVRRQPARYILLCVGSPQQEMLAAQIAAAEGTTGIGLCVGSALDFVAGVKRRAPVWMQRAHLEWLHRLAREPGRLWRRTILGFFPLVAVMRKVPRQSRGWWRG